MKRIYLILFLAVFGCSSAFAAGAKVSSLKGSLSVKESDTDAWRKANVGLNLSVGNKIMTAARSRAKVLLSDGSKVEVYSNTKVSMVNLKAKTPILKVLAGRIRAMVSKNRARERFQIHTPIAVCSVRGTEFDIDVKEENGETEIEVLEGLVGISKEDGGAEVELGPGEKITITRDKPISDELKSQVMFDRQSVKAEVGLSMSKEDVQNAAAQEQRLAEYQEGKTMIDVFGNRVRIEEYVMRSKSDEFKFVVLNEREARFDYYYFKGTFNKDLPENLSDALNSVTGILSVTAPEYYLTAYEKGFSNTQDSVKDIAAGGHLVKIDYNSNGTMTVTENGNETNSTTVNAYDPESGAYDPISDTFDTDETSALGLAVYNPLTDTYEDFSAGQTYWTTRYNSYEHIINDVTKQLFLPANPNVNVLVSELDGSMVYPSKDSLGNTIYGEWGVESTESTFPDGEIMHSRLKIEYLDNTYEQYDNYIISDEGHTASFADFSNITTGAAYKTELLKWNYEQVITASEFGGRKIDLVIEPKILIKSGLIK